MRTYLDTPETLPPRESYCFSSRHHSHHRKVSQACRSPVNNQVAARLELATRLIHRNRHATALRIWEPQPGQVLRITRRHSFAPVTIRKYRPGEHAVEPKINGKLFGRVPFMLV
jgi:hypothetical protein